MKKLRIVFIIIAALFAVLWGIRSYNGRRFHPEKETRFMMDTYVTIYCLGPKEITSKAIGLALDRMQEIDVKFNPLNPKSPVYSFNRTGKPVSDPEILGLVQIALKVSRESSGAFDITIAPILELWGFYSKEYRIPGEAEIKDYLANVGYRHLVIEDGKLKKDKAGVMIDLGGIAKGYAISEAVRILKANGVTSALVDAGGDIYALGKKGIRPWKVGIRDPRAEDIIGYVEVEGLAVMGSGDYERFFIKDAKRYHHIFDSKTGYPTEGVTGITIIYTDPILGQAWGKIPFVLGPEKGLKMLQGIAGMEAIVVTDSGEKLFSSGLRHALNTIK